MLNPEERRFLRSWEEQRKGGRWSYYLLYALGGSVLLFIGISFVASMIRFGLPKNLWAIPVISVTLAVILTVVSWQRNESRFRGLVRREIGATLHPESRQEPAAGERHGE